MPQQRLLYLDADCLTALRWQQGTLHAEGRFPHDEAGLAAFAEYLGRQRGSNYLMLADVADESFQVELLPYAQGADRTALLTRKLGQYFYGSPLSAAISYGREKSGRRDEKFLLAALTRPQLFEPWLAALRAAEAQLAGIWSLPLLGAALLAKLPPARNRCLLVAITRAGIRQSFFDNGRLLFSRLTPQAGSDISATAARCASEVVKIQQYLLGQRLLARGTSLPVLALVHPAQSGVFMAQCKGLEDVQADFQDLHAAGKAIGLKTLPQDSHSENLFLHLLAQNPPREQFAPVPERRFYRLWQIRAWLLRGGAVALFGCLLLAAHQVTDALKARSETETLLQQAQADAQRYQAIQATYPPMPASPEALRALINRFEALEKRSAKPEGLYLAISRALDASPRIEIERILWQLGGNPNEGLTLKSDGRGAPAAAGAGGMHEIAVVHGLLPASMATDQRGQLEAVNAFADALRKNPDLQVSIERMPFDIESGKALKSTGEAGQTAGEPRFVIHLSRKL